MNKLFRSVLWIITEVAHKRCIPFRRGHFERCNGDKYAYLCYYQQGWAKVERYSGTQLSSQKAYRTLGNPSRHVHLSDRFCLEDWRSAPNHPKDIGLHARELFVPGVSFRYDAPRRNVGRIAVNRADEMLHVLPCLPIRWGVVIGLNARIYQRRCQMLRNDNLWLSKHSNNSTFLPS